MPQTANLPVPPSTLWWESDTPAGLTRIGALRSKVLACRDDEGRLHGPMTLFDDYEGRKPVLECHWEHGQLHGRHTIWTPPYFRAAHFEAGRPQGRWTLYYQGVTLCWVEFDQGASTGAGVENKLDKVWKADLSCRVNGQPVASLEAALAMGPEVTHLSLTGWPEATLPEGMWALEHLEHLEIHRSAIDHIPAGIGRLHKLRALVVKQCQVGWLAAEIATLPELGDLWVTDCQLRSWPALANPKLHTVDFSGNILARARVSLGDCPALQTVKLARNHLMTLDHLVFDAPALRSLDVGGSPWLGWISPDLGKAGSLAHLNLQHQWLLTLPDEIGQCASLENLYLNNGRLAVPPRGLEARIVRKVDLQGSPFYAFAGLEDYDEQLDLAWDALRTEEQRAHALQMRQRRQAQREEAARTLAQQQEDQRLLALGDALSPEAAGFAPPAAIAPLAPVEEWYDARSLTRERLGATPGALADFERLAGLAGKLRSESFGCEHGGARVEALICPRPGEVPLVELLRSVGVLAPVETKAVGKLVVPNQRRQPITRRLEALAPTEGWQLEIEPRSRDLKLGFYVLQLAEEIWAAVGPRVRDHRAFRPGADFEAFEPLDGRARELLTVTCLRASAPRLGYRSGGRQEGQRVQIAFDRSRAGVIGRMLVQAGVGRTGALSAKLFEREPQELREIGQLLGSLEGAREHVVGGSAVYHRLWTAPHPEGPVLALRTRVVWT